MEKYITKNSVQYELRGEQYYPMLVLDEHTDYEIGKYGKMRLDYLKQHHHGMYTTLLTEGRLNEHLHEIDIQAREQVEWIIDQMSARMGVDDRVKTADLMRWAQEMNSIKASAEEAVLAEVVIAEYRRGGRGDFTTTVLRAMPFQDLPLRSARLIADIICGE